MSDQHKQVQTLFVQFNARDIEEKTRPMALVECPQHDGDVRPIAFCGKCGHCRQVAFISRQDIALACDLVAAEMPYDDAAPRTTPRWVHELTRVPRVCAGLDTPISLLVQHLSGDDDELVPVLDLEGMLVGAINTRDLLATLAAPSVLDATVEDLMLAAPRSIRFDAPEVDAIRMFGGGSARFLAVTSARSKFLGILWREDLACSA